MGGYIAFQFWRRYAARLRGLILCDTRAAADTPEAAAARRVMAERVLREGPAPLVETMLPRLLGETTRRQRPELVENVRRVMMAADPRAIAAAARGMAERPDMTASLPQIRCPTLVVVGSEDAISPPAEMRGIAEAIPGAELRRDSRRRPHLAAGEARRGERGDRRVSCGIVAGTLPVPSSKQGSEPFSDGGDGDRLGEVRGGEGLDAVVHVAGEVVRARRHAGRVPRERTAAVGGRHGVDFDPVFVAVEGGVGVVAEADLAAGDDVAGRPRDVDRLARLIRAGGRASDGEGLGARAAVMVIAWVRCEMVKVLLPSYM